MRDKIYDIGNIEGLKKLARNFVVMLVCSRKNMTEQRGALRILLMAKLLWLEL
jgi:hypothetical protein